MYKERALAIIRTAMYSDPMMDEVILVKEILQELPQYEAVLLIAVAAGIPINVFKNFYSYKISAQVNAAADKFVEKVDKVYASKE